MSGNGTVSGGSTFATNFFNANLTHGAGEHRLHEPHADGDRHHKRHDDHRHRFLYGACSHLLHGNHGFQKHRVSGTSSASYTLPTYINFYLMLDVSGSMSFPSTAAEQARLLAVNPDNYRQAIRRLHLRLSFHLSRALARRSA